MTEAPKRIGLVSDALGQWALWNEIDDEDHLPDAEYVRADLLEAARADERRKVVKEASEFLKGMARGAPPEIAGWFLKVESHFSDMAGQGRFYHDLP